MSLQRGHKTIQTDYSDQIHGRDGRETMAAEYVPSIHSQPTFIALDSYPTLYGNLTEMKRHVGTFDINLTNA
jgi:hypothetical protein